MSSRVLVTGANGRTGQSIIKALSSQGADVVAFIRNEKYEMRLKKIGASSVCVGNMLDRNTIITALDGIDTILHIGPPMHPKEKTIVNNFIQAARLSKVYKFIYYSVMHPLRRNVRHHSLKLDSEELIIESGLPYSIIQPIRYMQHLEPIWEIVLRDQIHSMPFNVDVKFNVVNLQDIAEATATITLDNSWLYGTYELAGSESLSQNDMAEIITRVIGKTVTARQTPISEMINKAQLAGVPDDRVSQMVTMNNHYNEFGFFGNSKTLEMIIHRKPMAFKEYVSHLHESSASH